MGDEWTIKGKGNTLVPSVPSAEVKLSPEDIGARVSTWYEKYRGLAEAAGWPVAIILTIRFFAPEEYEARGGERVLVVDDQMLIESLRAVHLQSGERFVTGALCCVVPL